MHESSCTRCRARHSIQLSQRVFAFNIQPSCVARSSASIIAPVSERLIVFGIPEVRPYRIAPIRIRCRGVRQTRSCALDSSNDSTFYAPGHARVAARHTCATRAMSHLILQSSVGGLCRRLQGGERGEAELILIAAAARTRAPCSLIELGTNSGGNQSRRSRKARGNRPIVDARRLDRVRRSRKSERLPPITRRALAFSNYGASRSFGERSANARTSGPDWYDDILSSSAARMARSLVSPENG